MESNEKHNSYKEIEKSVKRIKKFYKHLQVFVIMTIVLVLFSNVIINFFEARISNPNSLSWIKTNIWVNVLLWFFGLIIHGVFVFKFKANFIDNWEKKKMEEIMKENK